LNYIVLFPSHTTINMGLQNKPPPAVQLPSNYASLPWRHIKVTHVPESSPTVTPVILITLNRPEKYNAFTNTMMEDIVKAYELIDADDRVKAVVLTGAGNKAFCAGADLENGFPGGASKSGKVTSVKTERDIDHRDG
jgi:enoyl-CoA hydratase/carnithine racemase